MTRPLTIAPMMLSMSADPPLEPVLALTARFDNPAAHQRVNRARSTVSGR
jgi:hypothetical protein